jgi:hypothetical protein
MEQYSSVKNSGILKLLLALLFLTSSCNLHEKSAISLFGKWRYINEVNECAEFWFQENAVMYMDEVTYTPTFYEYLLKEDSLFFYPLGGENVVAKFEVQIQNNNKIVIKNEFSEFSLTRFTSKVEFDSNDSTLNKIYLEFGESLKRIKGSDK